MESGSFGRGVTSNFDMRLKLDGYDTVYTDLPEDAVGLTWASLQVPNASRQFNFEYVPTPYEEWSGPGYPPVSNVLRPVQRSRAEKLEILDDQMQPATGQTTTNYGPPVEYPDAKYARLTMWNGVIYVFELIDGIPGGQSPAHPDNGRLISASTRGSDVGYTIAYKSWTQTEIDESPTRQWQIDTVTDHLGNTLTFDYASQQENGSWVVEEVTLPNQDVIEYRYAGGMLSEVEYPDTSISTVSYSAQSSGLIKIEFHDLGADAQHRHKDVYVSGSVGTTGGTVVPTSVGMARLVVSGEGEVVYASSAEYGEESPADGAVYGLVYEGGGRAFGELHGVSVGGESAVVPRRYYLSDWTFEQGEGYMGDPGPYEFNGTLESTYSLYYGDVVNTALGQAAKVVDSMGREIEYTYDEVAEGRPLIRTDYSDETFETYCYNSLRQVTRYRDRNGNVTLYTYDAQGRRLSQAVGLTDNPNPSSSDPYAPAGYDRCATDDVQTSEYALTQWQYVPTGQNGAGRVSKMINPLGHETDYTYDVAGRLSKVEGPADSGEPRPETTMTYDSVGRLQTITDPLGHSQEFFYDFRNRRISILYDDGTTDRTIYGASGSVAGLVVKTIDRNGVVTNYDYDAADRLVSKITGFAEMVSGTEVATPELAVAETFSYLNGTNDLIEHRRAGMVTQHVYDYRGRRIGTRQFSDANQALVRFQAYSNNQLFSSEDAYGRKTYYAYDATDGRLIRTVQGLTPEFTLADFDAVLNLTRDTSANADYVISDMMHDAEGNVIESYDARSVKTENEYDSRDRQVVRIAAVGTALEARTETDYDAASNVLAVRSPRYFDSSDTEGYQNTEETWTYTPAGQQATHTEAAGTSLAVTETFAYDLLGRQISRTDYGGQTWETHYEDCCGQVIASENPLGHGSIVRKDPMGRSVHQVSYEDFSSHTGTLDDPIDAKTLREVTTKYDGRGRPVARTTWLVARGLVDVTDPPIAGLGSVSAADGLTEQYLYDDDLTDGVGLDNATGVTPLIGSTAVSLADALTKLAGTTANGGAGVSFDSDATGSARVTINPEGEVRFSISDGVGRSVMSGIVDDSSDLITWNCSVHDQTESIAGFGTVLASQIVNALGHVSKSLTDAAGRTIQSIDALGKITSYEYDASGNQLKVRDPNGVGQDCLYDALGRDTQCTDTASGVTQSGYDLAGNKVSSTDAKSNTTTYVFDARGRQIKQVDRLSGE
ncbi:YD repeat-containing protein, partial [Rhodopirellula europaea SH398]